MSYADKMARRDARLKARAEQRREWAEKAQQRSEKHAAAAQRIGDAIPVGQPILNGHHSANRHRRDIGRIERAYVASFTESEKAENHAYKAANAEGKMGMRNNLGFCHRRIKEAEALIRKLEREKDWRCSYGPEEAKRWQTLLDEAKDKALYWTRRLDAVTREGKA